MMITNEKSNKCFVMNYMLGLKTLQKVFNLKIGFKKEAPN